MRNPDWQAPLPTRGLRLQGEQMKKPRKAEAPLKKNSSPWHREEQGDSFCVILEQFVLMSFLLWYIPLKRTFSSSPHWQSNSAESEKRKRSRWQRYPGICGSWNTSPSWLWCQSGGQVLGETSGNLSASLTTRNMALFPAQTDKTWVLWKPVTLLDVTKSSDTFIMAVVLKNLQLPDHIRISAWLPGPPFLFRFCPVLFYHSHSVRPNLPTVLLPASTSLPTLLPTAQAAPSLSTLSQFYISSRKSIFLLSLDII